MEYMVVIYTDTRQKEKKHENIDKYFQSKNIEVIPVALTVGDYMLDPNGNVSVDTKQNIYELVSDFFSRKEKARFQRECQRARKLGIKLYILVEEKMQKEKLINWKSKKRKNGELITKATGKDIYKKMQIFSAVFNVAWRFCDKKHTGEKILELLGSSKND